MANTVDSNDADLICYFVNYPAITYSESPIASTPGKFSTASWSRIFLPSIALTTRGARLSRKSSQALLGRTLDDDLIHRLALREIGENVF